MSQSLKIAIIGDYNFTYNSHHATNLALDHSALFLDIDVNYYWIKLSEFVNYKPQQFDKYDGIWIAPGPIKNEFFLHGIIRSLIGRNVPVIITGEGFKTLVEVLINVYQLSDRSEKLISDNLVEGNTFERVSIIPQTKAFNKIYENHSKVELTATRYSIYPQLIKEFATEILDFEAYNHFEDPEVISLRNHTFFVACAYCPQISSTRELPHPLIYTFIKACELENELLKKHG